MEAAILPGWQKETGVLFGCLGPLGANGRGIYVSKTALQDFPGKAWLKKCFYARAGRVRGTMPGPGQDGVQK